MPLILLPAAPDDIGGTALMPVRNQAYGGDWVAHQPKDLHQLASGKVPRFQRMKVLTHFQSPLASQPVLAYNFGN